MPQTPLLRSTRSRLLALGGVVVIVIAAWPDAPAQGTSADGTPAHTSPRPSSTATLRPTPSGPTQVPTQVPTQGASAPTVTASSSPVAPPSPPGAAVLTLATLPVKGRASMTGYDRSLFGQAWADVDRNGCDTRNDILRRDLTAYTLKADTRGCLVLRGLLRDPYTGTDIAFVRGPGTSSAVQIDHVVALGDAWQKGARAWSTARRTAFANDPLNLLAVDGPTNERKGDGDAATWLPPLRSGRCAYVARQIAVKHRYGLWVTAAERDAMVRVLQSCPGQVLPVAGPVPLGGGRVQQASQTPTATTSVPARGTATDPRFATCRAAIAAGYGPYRRGIDTEYGWYQDRDHDGVVCER